MREALLAGSGAAWVFLAYIGSLFGIVAAVGRSAKFTIGFSVLATLLLVFLSGCSENVPQREAREKSEQRVKAIENELDRPRKLRD